MTLLTIIPGLSVCVLTAAALLAAGAHEAARGGPARAAAPLHAEACSSELEHLVRARVTAWFTSDEDVYQRLTTHQFLWNGSADQVRRKSSFPDSRPFDISDFRVIAYPSVAIVNYTLTEYLNYEEGAPFDRRRRTETWIRSGGTWKAATAQSNEHCSSNSGRWLCF